MQFASTEFAFFFLAVLTVWWLLKPFERLRKPFLFIVSLYFYSRWDLRLLSLILGSAVVNYGLGEGIARVPGARGRAAVMWTGVLFNLGMLGLFKYYEFFRSQLDALLQLADSTSGLPVLELLLPLGISFYSIQSITYLVDLHRGYGTRARGLFDYLLYITFFPQILIGPIVRSRDLLPQFHDQTPQQVPDLSLAVSLILSGLFKKVVLATYLATRLCDDAFVSPENYSSVELLVAAYGYSVQIYCDFSGYVDMARGVALLLGYQLPDNFDGPLAAKSIADFWRRWHITFSNCMRDYIYLPLGGSRGTPLRVYTNLMISLLVAGLWHGAHWKFVVWGAIHGGAIIAYKMVQDRRRRRGIDVRKLVFPGWYIALGWLYTFHVVVLARIFFRTPDLDVAGRFFSGLTELTFVGRGIEWPIFVCIAIGLYINFRGKAVRAWFVDLHERTPPLLRPVLWAAAAVLLFALQPADVAPYIYYAF